MEKLNIKINDFSNKMISFKWTIEKKITYEDFREEDVGEVKAYITKTRPFRIWCNGATISKTTNPEYTTLVDLIKIEVGGDAAHPMYHADADKVVLLDLRGASIRGIDDAANRDMDGIRKAGDYQADENKTHAHPHTHGFGRASNTGTKDTVPKGLETSPISTTQTGSDATAQGDTENKVKNIALYYLIKY